MVAEKTCKGPCGRSLPKNVDHFYFSRTGAFSHCKTCWNEKMKLRAKSLRTKARKDGGRGYKVCKTCGDRKRRRDFYIRGGALDGRNPHCKTCEQQKGTKQRDRLRVEDWIGTLLVSTKYACRRLNREFNLTVDDVWALYNKQRGRCYWYGVALTPSVERRTPQKPSLDRLDNARGYTKDNVVLACYAANFGRSVASAETFSAFVAELRVSMRADPSL